MQDENTFEQLLNTHRLLVADGGMGTLLFERGMEVGGCPEFLNVDRPDIVAGIHQDYVAAGADIILTNTFGGTRARLGHYHLEAEVDDLNSAGVGIARSIAATADRPVAVAGSMGPTGELFTPYGPLDRERALTLFGEQAAALDEAGVDVLWIETMSSVEELGAAFDAGSTTGLPIVATMSFDTHGKTMMGISPDDLATWAGGRNKPPLAIGANCGIGPEDVVAAVQAMAEGGLDIVLVAKANCGLPVFVDGELEYPLKPNEMPPFVAAAIRSGARIIGTCCGSVPGHIEAVRAVVDGQTSRP